MAPCMCGGNPAAGSDVLNLRPEAVPACAWGRNFWAPAPAKKKPLKPTAMQTLPLLPLGFRMWRHIRHKRRETGSNLTFMDPFNDWEHDTSHGVPLGGIGCGALGRGWRGDFRRYSAGQVPSGAVTITDDTPHTAFTICAARAGSDEAAEACVLLPRPKQAAKGVRYLDEDTAAESYALYPRAWQVYEQPTGKAGSDDLAYTATCEQLSPVIPHDYEASCLPCGCFEWTIENRGAAALDIAVLLTQHNGITRTAQTAAAGRHTAQPDHADHAHAVLEHPLGDDPGAWCIAAAGRPQRGCAAEDVSTSVCCEWPADGFSQLVSKFAAARGDLPAAAASVGKPRLGAVSAKVRVPPGATRTLRFAMAWDFPVSRFGRHAKTYTLRYTQLLPPHGRAAALAQRALTQMHTWRDAIAAWQRRITDDASLPLWYRGCVLNEAYYLSAGGSVWTVDGGYARPPTAGDAETSPDLAGSLGENPRARPARGANREWAPLDDPVGTSPTRVADADCLSDVSDAEFVRGMEAGVWGLEVCVPPTAPPPGATAPEESTTPPLPSFDVTGEPPLSSSDTHTPSPPAPSSPTGAPIGHFVYLEGHEYRMFNSYDVHFYASFALAYLFPELQCSVTLDLAKAFLLAHPEERQYLGEGTTAVRKELYTIPHDAGGPTEAPWELSNIYCIHNVSRWKDLPLKFVLMVYRDYVACGRRTEYLRKLWHVLRKALATAEKKFTAGTGMIINDAWPDQTYDAWCAQGVSAYCGGLWLAALRVAETTAGLLGHSKWQAHYAQKLKHAQDKYEALWNPAGYYNYTCAATSHGDSIMADQCCGEWYVRACGLASILPAGRARRALKTVHKYNVVKFGAIAQRQHEAAVPLRGAVNGMRPNGAIDSTSMQSSECWTGTTFAVAAHMILEGLRDEAFDTARGIAEGNRAFGFWFNTPEAWLANGSFRSLGYMRPLSVWALQWSLDKRGEDGPHAAAKADTTLSIRHAAAQLSRDAIESGA